jgi:hypothetical protein
MVGELSETRVPSTLTVRPPRTRPVLVEYGHAYDPRTLLAMFSTTIADRPDDLAREHSLLTTALVAALLPADVPEGRRCACGLFVPSISEKGSFGSISCGISETGGEQS